MGAFGAAVESSTLDFPALSLPFWTEPASPREQFGSIRFDGKQMMQQVKCAHFILLDKEMENVHETGKWISTRGEETDLEIASPRTHVAHYAWFT
jgi:hypothetical protein